MIEEDRDRLNLLREQLEKLYLVNGLTEEVINLSQELDIVIAKQQEILYGIYRQLT